MRVWDAQTRQTLRVLQNPAKGPVTALLVLHRPPHLAAGARGGSGGSSGSGSKGPQRPAPLVKATCCCTMQCIMATGSAAQADCYQQ